MRRILELELDANFFHMGQAAIKSFLKHNPEWELHVCDLGLTDAQHEELAAVGTVEHSTVWERGRWPHSTARMVCLAKFCRLPDTVILHLDADTLTFGSIDPLIAELRRADIPIMLTPRRSEMSEWLFSFTRTKEIFKHPENWYSHHCYNFGVALMTASEQLAQICERANEKYTGYHGMFRGVDQTVLVAELLDAGVMIVNMPNIYNFNPADSSQGSVALFNPPLLGDGTELVILHIPVAKPLVFAADAPMYSVGWWWQQWLDRYKEEPWPITA